MKSKTVWLIKRWSKNQDLPTGISDIPRNLHLLCSSFIQILQTTRQCAFYCGAFSWRGNRALTGSTSKRSKYIIPKHTPRKPGPARTRSSVTEIAHASETREPEKLRENIVRTTSRKPKRRRSTGLRPAGKSTGTRRRHLSLQPFLSVLIVHCSLLRITQNLSKKIKF